MSKKFLALELILDVSVDQGKINILVTLEVSLFLIQSSRSTEAEYLFLVENA